VQRRKEVQAEQVAEYVAGLGDAGRAECIREAIAADSGSIRRKYERLRPTAGIRQVHLQRMVHNHVVAILKAGRTQSPTQPTGEVDPNNPYGTTM